jgi:hypothetical protein
MKSIFFLVPVLAVLVSPVDAFGLDLADLRTACQQESKRRFKGRGKMKPDVYRLVVERRTAFVQSCMSEGPRAVERTASVPRTGDRIAVTADTR